MRPRLHRGVSSALYPPYRCGTSIIARAMLEGHSGRGSVFRFSSFFHLLCIDETHYRARFRKADGNDRPEPQRKDNPDGPGTVRATACPDAAGPLAVLLPHGALIGAASASPRDRGSRAGDI